MERKAQEVVCITAKIHFLKQFTTVCLLTLTYNSCLYYCKDTLFEAIHNFFISSYWWDYVVCITAKIHFLKQFTTLIGMTAIYPGCLYYCKDTLFEAIHNSNWYSNSCFTVVCITAKIHFLKQFTTALGQRAGTGQLFVLLQRYTFWSNSQRPLAALALQAGCLYYCKDTLFEAIHNIYSDPNT